MGTVRTLKLPQDVENWKQFAEYDIVQAVAEFSQYPPEVAVDFAEKLGIPYLADLATRAKSDVAAEFLRTFPEDIRESIIFSLPEPKASHLKEIFSFPAESAGSLMSKEFFAVPLEFTIKEATEYLQSLAQEKKGGISYIYAVDKNHRIAGILEVRDLIILPSYTKIKDIARNPVVQVEGEMTQRDVAKLLQKHHYLGIPVVNREQQLIGVIKTDNILSFFQKEADDDIAKSVGIATDEIRTRSIRKIVRSRLPWLFVSMASGLLCAAISGLFQNSLSNIVILLLFVPIVLGLSESIGVQAATIIVRNLATDSVKAKDLSFIFLREMFVGSIIGMTCGLSVGLIAWMWQGFYFVGLSIAFSMAITMFISSLLGLSLPLLFKKIKIDPAIASGPFTLAICDIQTLFVYFTTSSFILGSR